MFKPGMITVDRNATKVPVALLLCAAATVTQAASEWLAVCSKCVSPAIFSKSGINTANARAEARITRTDIQGWCANWQPDDKSCVKQQLAAEDLTRIYRATANCPAGRITPIDGKTYVLAGVWDSSDIGAGRSKWRDAAGRIVGRDNASGGLGISQQWEVLCPAAGGGARSASPRSGNPPVAATTPSAAARPGMRAPSAAQFSVGQIVQARYGREWIRARVNQVRTGQGPGGPEISYDVSLDNGKRGVVPARMLRAP